MKPPGANSTLALSPVAENISTSAPHPPPSSAALCTQETHERLCYERVYLFTVGRVILCTVKISSMLRFQFFFRTRNTQHTVYSRGRLRAVHASCVGRAAWRRVPQHIFPAFRAFGFVKLRSGSRKLSTATWILVNSDLPYTATARTGRDYGSIYL